ncbi:uncharacterized protein LOC129303796 isoform X2 [Prosopis cineraria]|uniref:uncharacterized protein LOC129303796 isoform X2 n=1 Tax=Prosopis cineraria TaxID=364024 RepID=UPI002410468A|nr:uncharacterized protein LOC129303796 isoform X2 [Prosopis cineraria]
MFFQCLVLHNKERPNSVMGGRSTSGDRSKIGGFFFATLLLWLGSVCYCILFNNRIDLLFIIAGSLFYQAANWVVRIFFSRDPLFVNTSVSLLHSTATSASVVFILYRQWSTNGSKGMFEHSRLVEGTWPWAYEALCFSCGYFAYDQWDMLRYHLYSGWIPSILLHSIFLHVRKVRRMAGFRDAKNKIAKVEWLLNWGTFFVARLASHILITVKLIKDAHRFGRGVELPLALFGMAGMNLLNIGLGIDLFNAFKRERESQTTYRRE